ncbi:hypothetical protein MTP99_017020 [Tenebrio molitor]|jgi:hypothetical protein|nr:hypothetical protein MTP99_017020 [Tenebrio molitor]
MGDDSSSGFGDESPVLFKPLKKLDQVYVSSTGDINIQDLYSKLLLHLKKTKIIPRNDLKMLLEIVEKKTFDDHKNRWLLMKIRGLLKYLLKTRANFQNSIVKGEITIYEKSFSQEENQVIMKTPNYFSPPSYNSTIDVPVDLLTNNNFVSINAGPNLTKMETTISYNYSEDMFADNIETLHNFSHENYQILKRLTQNNTDISTNCLSEDDDKVFKVPPAVSSKIDKVCKVHDSLDESFSYLTPTLSQVCTPTREPTNSEVENVPDAVEFNPNIFDDLTITDDQLKEEFDREYEEIEKWMSKITCNLIHLKINEVPKFSVLESEENTSVLNKSTASSGSSELKTYHSEENFKIIREACLKFRKNLEKKRSLQKLQDFINLAE